MSSVLQKIFFNILDTFGCSSRSKCPEEKSDNILLKGLDVDYSLPEGEPAAVNRLDFTAPNVRTAKPLNSAYLDPCDVPRQMFFDLIYYYTIRLTHFNRIWGDPFGNFVS